MHKLTRQDILDRIEFNKIKRDSIRKEIQKEIQEINKTMKPLRNQLRVASVTIANYNNKLKYIKI